jgi:hypothetical protein
MAGVHCFTSISFAYLDRARVLAETVRKFHPDWTLWLCLSDREPPGFEFNIKQEQFDHLVRIEELGIADLEQWIFSHNVVELCTAVKGPMLDHILKRGADKVIYLDPDIALFGSLREVPKLLDRYTIVLTPHLTAPEKTRAGVWDHEIGTLKYGTYNLGFIAVRGCAEGKRFAAWWKERLIDFCRDDIPEGLFTDQRWCDLIPSLFEATYVLRDPGYNVASWNISNRPISFDWDGMITVAGHPLRFFHFTKINSVGEAVLELYSGGRHEVFELLRWYRERLAAHAAHNLPDGWWKFDRYEDGKLIPQSDRALYRTRADLREEFPRPFESAGHSFQSWCQRSAALNAQSSRA